MANKKKAKIVEELDEDTVIEEKNIVEEKDDFEELSLEDRVFNIEKKTNAIFVMAIITMIICLVSLIVVIAKDSNNNKKSESSSTNTETTSNESGYSTEAFNVIKGSEIANVSKGKTAVIWIGRQNCGYCKLFAPVVGVVQDEYGFKANYIDLYSIVNSSNGQISDQDSYNALMNMSIDKSCKSYVYDENNQTVPCSKVMESRFGSTPMTLFVKDGKMVGALSGYVQTDGFKEIVEQFGFSK